MIKQWLLKNVLKDYPKILTLFDHQHDWKNQNLPRWTQSIFPKPVLSTQSQNNNKVCLLVKANLTLWCVFIKETIWKTNITNVFVKRVTVIKWEGVTF